MPANLEFAYPWLIWLLPLPLILYWIIPVWRTRSASLILPIFNNAVDYTGQKPRKSALVKRRNILGWLTLLLAWAGILLTMSSPRLVGEPEYQVKTSRNFLIVADISFSMAQEDWTTDGQKARRWDAVKQVMTDFIKERKEIVWD